MAVVDWKGLDPGTWPRRFTLSATPDECTLVRIPGWARDVSVEVIAADGKAAREGEENGAISTDYWDCRADNDRRIPWKPPTVATREGELYVSSGTGSAVVVVTVTDVPA